MGETFLSAGDGVVGFDAGGVAESAAVVVAATNETHASNRFTAILNYGTWVERRTKPPAIREILS
jgi:hypothetical protein